MQQTSLVNPSVATVLLALLASNSLGCGTSALHSLRTTIPMPAPMSDTETGAARRNRVRLTRAAYCAHRAEELASDADTHRDIDVLVVVLAAVSGIGGAVLNASALAISDSDDAARRGVLGAGSGLVAGSAGLFALRAALNFGDVARREREAAVRMAGYAIDAAFVGDADVMEASEAAFDDCVERDVDLVPSLELDEQALRRLVEAIRASSAGGGGAGGSSGSSSGDGSTGGTSTGSSGGATGSAVPGSAGAGAAGAGGGSASGGPSP